MPRPLTVRLPTALAPALATVVALVLTACSGPQPGSRTVPLPSAPPSPTATGDLSVAGLQALLLQTADLPQLTSRRPSARATLSTQAIPQLALCTPTVPDAPHEIANVLMQSGVTGQVEVFEVVSAYADEAGAQAAYDRAQTAARSCPSYTAQDTSYAVQDLADVALGAATPALHYRLTTPTVVSGDVRTLARSGRFLVLVSGFGAPPAGQSLLDYQADVMRKALARLG